MTFALYIKSLTRLVLIAGSLIASMGYAECKVTVRWSEDPPYTFQKLGRVQGIEADIARTVLTKMNCKTEFIRLPWARALRMLAVGQVDILTGAYKTAEREEFAIYSAVPHYSPNVLFTKKNNSQRWDIHTLSDLAKTTFKLGAQIDVNYGGSYETLLTVPEFRNNLHFNSSRQALWKMLHLGRIDGVIADKTTGRLELKNLGWSDDIVPSSVVVSQQPAYTIFSKVSVSEAFVSKYDRFLKEMKDNGEISAIESYYLD